VYPSETEWTVSFSIAPTMMASQKAAGNEVIVLFQALEILHVWLRTWKITTLCI
jgi:hypothetical protein